MFSFFKKKKIIPHIKLSGVIGNVGKFKQGIDFAGQEEIIKKAFSLKKSPAVAISINSPGGSPVQSHLIHDFIKSQAIFDYKREISLSENELSSSNNDDLISNNNDDLYSKAVDIVIKQQKISTSYIQRYLQIGYNRAARIVEKMEEDGIISEANNAGKRHVLKK